MRRRHPSTFQTSSLYRHLLRMAPDWKVTNEILEKTDEELSIYPNRIADSMADRSILITGGTGFMGKVLLEKILRSCPKVAKIYLLVRPKKGKDPNQRIKELFTSPLFDRLKSEQDGVLSRKVVGVAGDVLISPDLGLSLADKELLCRDVSIVYHGAATIRFDEPLKRAVMLNTRGTRQMLELAKEMHKLELFLHISTAYCHLQEKVLYEKMYNPPADPHSIIKCMESVDDDVAEAMTKKVLGDLPNTYAFTKALSEGLVNEQMDKMPVLILRPSIVVPVWKEPLPGWTDNINGPTGLLIGAGKGVIRTMYCNQEGYADYLPVDIAVNGFLVATWNYIANKDYEKRIYHLTSSSEIRISWAEIIERGRRITEKIPLNNIAWYPGGSMKKSKLLHNICVFFFHLLPAYFIDSLIFLAGHKPIEKKAFKIDGEGLDIDSYFEHCISAARIYILNEPLDTLPAARRHMRMMYWVDVITKMLFFGFLMYMLVSVFDTFLDVSNGIYRLTGHVLSDKEATL
uniref:Fatty acyl-CoA reductase n=1 Tax=Timema douglasi TaxID=61478 RepID=A0A7R8Z709_TIMDO|nr:unnamed protein product [Timema douglasi]